MKEFIEDIKKAVAVMKDKGIICHGEFEGKKVIGIRLNWNKRYITLYVLSRYETISGTQIQS